MCSGLNSKMFTRPGMINFNSKSSKRNYSYLSISNPRGIEILKCKKMHTKKLTSASAASHLLFITLSFFTKSVLSEVALKEISENKRSIGA